MDKQQFQQRLLELVYVNEEHFNRKPITENLTVPLTIKEVIKDLKPCEYACGANVTDQRSQVVRKDNPYPHWLTQCRTCGLYQHPRTGQMVSQRDLHAYYALFLVDNMRNV